MIRLNRGGIVFIRNEKVNCSRCKRVLRTKEIVFRLRFRNSTVIVCGDCAASDFNCRRWDHPQTCGHCGRLVVYESSKRWLQFTACSVACRKAIVAQAVKEARERRREKRVKKCKECGWEFTPKRTDSSYCSAACKQMACRRRLAYV